MPWRMSTEPRFESVVERQIREAMERGEFSDLPGAGAPLEDASPFVDPDWWGRRLMRRERARQAADEVRRLVREEVPRLKASRDREGALERAARMNEMIEAVNIGLAPGDRI